MAKATINNTASLSSLPNVSGLSLVEDSFESNSYHLFQYYLKNWAQSKENRIILLVLLATPINEVIPIFERTEEKKVIIFDFHTNAYNWREKNEYTYQNNSNIYIQSLPISDFLQTHKHIQTHLNNTNSTWGSIIIDSVSSLLLRYDVNKVRNYLELLYSTFASPFGVKQSSLISFIHSDSVPYEDLKRVEYGINTVISVDLPPSEMEIIVEDKKKKKKLENENNNSSLVIENSLRYLTIRHLRPTGRVAWANEGFGVDRNSNVVPMKLITQATEEISTQPEADPTANLTFNLKLSENEKLAKDNVILPYMFHVNPKNTGGTILIEEEDDDYDAEDPDDDLDI